MALKRTIENPALFPPCFSKDVTSSRFALLVFISLIFAPSGGALGQDKTIAESCYTAVGPLLEKADGQLSAEVRTAYLDWAADTVVAELGNQTVPKDCLAEVRANATLRDAIFGAVFPPDPNILQNYAHLRGELGVGFFEKYRSLAIAVAVAKRIKGVETRLGSGGAGDNFGRDYQSNLWADESLQTIRTEAEKELIAVIAEFLKGEQVTALELYKNPDRQQQLVAFLKERSTPSSLIEEVKQSWQFGQRLKNAMVLLGQRPARREEKPDTVAWLRHLVSIYEATPRSTPTVDGKAMLWPLFPIPKAPWPLLMPLARPVPLGEAQYIWEAFQGEHGPDRYHTFGPFRGGDDAMPYKLQPSPWFWDAWPDRILHGGMCVPISKGTVDLYSCLGKPAVWAGQPGHANLLSFQFVGGAWTAEIEQAFAGGPNVTFAQWYFDEDPGTGLHFRDDNWAGAEYHLGLVLAMNRGLLSYMDTRLAAHIFKVLPDKEKRTIGVKLLKNALATNPFNPDIWYRLAMLMPDAMDGLRLVQSAMGHSSDRLGFWPTLGEFVTRYSILAHPAPPDEPGMRHVYQFLQTIPGITADDLDGYTGKFLQTESHGLLADGVKYDQQLASEGDAYGQLRMGQRYRDGDGVPKDETKAGEFFAYAAARGGKAAALSLAKLVSADFVPNRRAAAGQRFFLFSAGHNRQCRCGAAHQLGHHCRGPCGGKLWRKLFWVKCGPIRFGEAKTYGPARTHYSYRLKYMEQPAAGCAPSGGWIRNAGTVS
ncbi:MAG: hypothetical protein ACLQVY_26565 [Limisphaerales bacterium]